MKKQLLLLLFLTSVIFHPTSVNAATASPSATPSETQDIQEKIKKMVEENLSTTESNLKEKINLQTLVGYVGTIKSINSGNLTIDSKEGTLIQITTSDKTIIVKSGATSKLSSLALADKIIIIGTLIKDDIVLAKKISVVVDEPNPVTTNIVVAKISSINLQKKIMGLNQNETEIVYSLTKKSTVKLGDFEVGQTIFAIAKKYEGKDYLSRAKVI
jgi:hypothetical protein